MGLHIDNILHLRSVASGLQLCAHWASMVWRWLYHGAMPHAMLRPMLAQETQAMPPMLMPPSYYNNLVSSVIMMSIRQHWVASSCPATHSLLCHISEHIQWAVLVDDNPTLPLRVLEGSYAMLWLWVKTHSTPGCSIESQYYVGFFSYLCLRQIGATIHVDCNCRSSFLHFLQGCINICDNKPYNVV